MRAGEASAGARLPHAARSAVPTAVPTAVWCGFEGVLTPALPRLMRELADRLYVPAYALNEAIAAVAGAGRGSDPAAACPAAAWDAGPHWAQAVERELEEQFAIVCDLSRFPEVWRAVCRPCDGWREAVGRLRRRGAFVGLLVPGPLAGLPDWLHRARTELFDATAVFPGPQAGLLGTEAFAWAVRVSGRSAGDSVLIDADERRCEQARRAGWRGVLFGAGDELSELLLPAPAGPSAVSRRTA
ncbi:hypothetical protein KGA66_15080 [Actinocrinis puniceicyclus]|uniref:Uncharacterized protein n=1 Tax=Actinocrinis puniceicyclus TaxID=977794 RepID=A0A8J7WQQ9_9ACTN|nr:hypothetical protein [Actinocrinis puniceicyclus]MBS2964379.1 hypothetical protein [Actinocrinis puniceicyclus]